jgi:hypothetical protein
MKLTVLIPLFLASSFFGGIYQPSGFGCGDHYFQLLVFLPPFVSFWFWLEKNI